MACEAVQSWSLGGLLAAFFDLAIAYTLLCVSAAAYFASKFLDFFWLRLPFPCDGLVFNIRSKSLCLNSLFVEFPKQIVSHVQLSVKDRFPFHGNIAKNCSYGEICGNGYIETKGETSCSSVWDGRKAGDGIRIKELSPRAEKYDLKGKGVVGHRPRSRLRRLRKGNGGLGKNSADSPMLELEPYSDSRGNELVGGSSLMGGNHAEVQYLEYDDKASTTLGVIKRAVAGVEENPFHDEDVFLASKELQNDRHEVQTFTGDEKNTIRVLEQKLEDERSARAALYMELEKERSAAASAADEAMAMILRLQEEKAATEMEARQYQRILEEKSVYDDEEMTILKEILVRREIEKHFLEKEVVAYRHTNEQIAGGGSDTILIPHKLQGEILYSDGVVSIDYPTSKLVFTNESCPFKEQGDSDDVSVQMSVCSSVGNMDLQEKEIISVDTNLQNDEEGKEVEQIQAEEEVIVKCHGDWRCGPNWKEKTKDTYLGLSSSCGFMAYKDSQTHDVHVDGNNLDPDKNKQQLFGSESSTRIDFPSCSGVESLRRSNSGGFPPIGAKGICHEMFKIKNEVGWLEERLKLVQEGRGKLSQERIDGGRAARQVSLPLPISKGGSKKRRSRSVCR